MEGKVSRDDFSGKERREAKEAKRSTAGLSDQVKKSWQLGTRGSKEERMFTSGGSDTVAGDVLLQSGMDGLTGSGQEDEEVYQGQMTKSL